MLSDHRRARLSRQSTPYKPFLHSRDRPDLQDAANMTIAQVGEEANRPDGVVVLNPGRQNKEASTETLQNSSDSSVSQQKMQILSVG